ncbi:MAG TPA: inositol monophosphatase family protein [Chloroflexota bacterium]|jgi:myo-inositol-1(or 4)-monophosphatase
MDDLEQVLAVAERAARLGGEIARAKIDEPGQYYSWKRSRDPFVAQSLVVQEAILQTIRASFPDAAVLAEEGPEDEEMPVAADPLWIVDPICGSLNYMHRDPDYTVSVGYLSDGAWKVGVVYEPERDAMYTAMEGGGGAFRNGQRIVVDQFADGAEAWSAAAVAVDWPGDLEARKEMLTVVSTILPAITSLRIMGSPALALCHVASGRLHGYSALDLRPWDVAPAGVILQCAGGTLTNFSGSSWYHSPDGGYVASNSIIHGRLLQSSQALIALRRMAADRAARLKQGL